MKGKFGLAALLFSSLTFAVPVSTPNQVSDIPIIAGGGNAGNLSMNNCRAYQTDGAVVNLSGGEVLVFYGGGWGKNGGYLATKTTYSGPAYVKLSKFITDYCCNYPIDGTAIGLFARNTHAQQDFIAGAGGSYRGRMSGYSNCSPASGGGWQGEPSVCNESDSSYRYVVRIYTREGGSVYPGDRMTWFHVGYSLYYADSSSAGFFGAFFGGGASSISAWYNYYTKDYTSPVTSVTITGGGITGKGRLYVCQ